MLRPWSISLIVPSLVTSADAQNCYLVSNTESLRHELQNHEVKFDSIFTPTQAEASQAVKGFRSYLQAEINGSPWPRRKAYLQEILANETEYVWFVSGFTMKGKRHLYCYFTTHSPRNLNQPISFPSIQDGGTEVCQALFDLKQLRFTQIWWNGSA